MMRAIGSRPECVELMSGHRPVEEAKPAGTLRMGENNRKVVSEGSRAKLRRGCGGWG